MTFRTRLSLAYAISWVLILAATLLVAYFSISFGLQRHVERTLIRDLADVSNLYESGQSGDIKTVGVRIGFYNSESGIIISDSGSEVGSAEQLIPTWEIQQATDSAKIFVSSGFTTAFKKNEALGAVISIAQDTSYIADVRNALIRSLLQGFAALLPIGVFITALAGKLSTIPLLIASTEVSKRNPQNLEPINYTGANDELGNIVARVNELLAALKEARYREKAFLAEVSHELRTPITSLNGYVDRVSRNPADQDSLEGAKRTLAHVTRMVGDLLALAKGEAQREVNAHIVLLPDILKQIVDEYPGVSLEVKNPDAEVLGDPDRLLQLARNLVSNAVRAAGRTDGVKAKAWTQPQFPVSSEPVILSDPLWRPGRDAWAIFSVTDNGHGIDATVLPKLFTRFARGPEGGTGLGLAVVKQIAEAHAGIVQVSSKKGETIFTVALPLLSDEE